MKKIKPALCTACLRASQKFESDTWPGVRVCFQCYRNLRNFMLAEGLADSNSFFFYFVEPLTEGNYPYRMSLHDGSQLMACMGPSKYDSRASGLWHVKVPVELESENNIQDELDNLFNP